MKLIPIFSSALGSINKSILTLDYKGEIKEDEPVSIFDIAKTHGLNEVFICDKQMSSYIKAYENSKKAGIKLRYGLRMTLAHNEDQNNIGDYQVFAKNTDGYYELIELSSLWAHKNIGNKNKELIFFEEIMDKLASPNLKVIIPFYDSFLFNNKFTDNKALPNLIKINPLFAIENHDIVFDHLIQPYIYDYCKKNKFRTINTHSVYYYKKEDFTAYLVYRAVENRGTWFKPELKHFSSNKFSFEDLL